MAEVSGALSQSTIKNSYFPTIPPKAPKAAVSYNRALNEAPYTALMGVVPDLKMPDRHPISPRCRIRNQAGMTNRWRLPESLYSDLLGNTQAIKSIAMPYNHNLINIITGRLKVTPDDQRNALSDAIEYQREMYEMRNLHSLDEAFPTKSCGAAKGDLYDDSFDSDDEFD